MKYIKMYEEELSRPYRVGDVVVYAYDDFYTEEEKRIGTIFDISSRLISIENKYPKESGKINKHIDNVYEFQILRLATPEDYEEFELKNNADKYNL